MIKVLFIGMTSNPGGMETYMINIFSKLEGHGFHFDFLNIDTHPLAYSSYIKRHGGTIRQVAINGKFKHLTRMSRAKRFFKYHHDYDIVHMNTIYLDLIYWLKAAKRYGIKHLIIQSHNCGSNYKTLIFHILNATLSDYNKLYLQFHPNIHKLAASIACGKWMFGKRSNFKVINNGIDTNVYSPNYKYRNLLKKKLGINRNFKIIITTARIERQKNYPKIINVFKWINKYNKYIKLVIIGSGSEKSMIKSMVKHYHLSNNVIFLGQMNKNSIAKYLNIADLMLMPSLYEAIPFSLTEAQSVGVPALVSLDRIPNEANITGGVNFISLKRSDKYWANKALNILNKSFNLHKRIKMNKRVKKSNFNINNSVNNIKHIYKKINVN